MKLKLKTIENLILLLIIGQVVVFRYFNVYETMNKVILALIALRIVLNLLMGRGNHINIKENAVGVIGVVLLLALNGLLYGNNQTFKSNVLMMFYPIMNMFYLTWYVKKYQDSFYRRMIQLKYVINIYFVINIIVMFIQLQGNYFMVGVVTQENTMYQDLVSGLLGYSMTAAVCYFSTFVMAYNVVVSDSIKGKLRKKTFTIYNIALILMMAYISTQNDNVQYFVFVSLALIILMLSKNRLSTASGLQKVILLLLVCIFGITVAISIIPGLYETLNDRVLYKFTGAIEHMYDGASVIHGSMERLALVVYGLAYADGWALGKGFSYSGVYTPYTFGFVHFGNANIGALICLGGIWFYVAMIHLYSKRLVGMIEHNAHNDQKVFFNIMIPTFLVAASTFSLPLTDVSISLCVMFILLVFGLSKYMEINEEFNCEKRISAGRNSDV